MSAPRIVITGMSVLTRLGDELDTFYENLLAGKSSVVKWRTFKTDGIYAKVGADLFDYDVDKAFSKIQPALGEETVRKAQRLMKNAPWGEKLTILTALKASLDAKMAQWAYDPYDCATIVAGHNLNLNYEFTNHDQFNAEPDFIEGLFALRGLDTDHAGIVSELLTLKGSAYTVGGACASGNIALKLAVDEILHHDMKAAVVVAPVLDFSPLEFQGLAMMEAISYRSFNEAPEKASRPYDLKREGFVPAHGAAALVVERLETAKERGAKIHAEVLGVEASADANHLPQPSQEGQARLMQRLLKRTGVRVEEIDYINAHATSTPLGDLTEIRAIKQALGKRAYEIKINAPKSMLGHTCWSAATVETVAAILQMNRGKLHPSINIDELEPEVDLDVCRGKAVDCNVNIFLKNSFGFGGLNCIALFKKHES
ncbi:MAG TPA: beta-ketoacyl-[acyl-carrier-protein] synthase family protein [bacterium]|nr:beta-ketoacyl-[acyl-carrier-protein] synthase family protein [bacterium]